MSLLKNSEYVIPATRFVPLHRKATCLLSALNTGLGELLLPPPMPAALTLSRLVVPVCKSRRKSWSLVMPDTTSSCRWNPPFLRTT
jgi:hypothetical protein